MKHCAKKLLGLAFALALCLAVGGTALAQTPEFADVPAALPEQEMLAYEPYAAPAAGNTVTGNIVTDGYQVTIPTTVTVESGTDKETLMVTADVRQMRTLTITLDSTNDWQLKHESGQAQVQVGYSLTSDVGGGSNGNKSQWMYNEYGTDPKKQKPELYLIIGQEAEGKFDINWKENFNIPLTVQVTNPSQATMSGTYSDTVSFEFAIASKKCITYFINVYEQELQLTSTGTHVEAVDMVDRDGKVKPSAKLVYTEILEYPTGNDVEYPWSYSGNEPDATLRWEEATATMNTHQDVTAGKVDGNNNVTINLNRRYKCYWLDVNGATNYNGESANGNQGGRISGYVDMKVSADDGATWSDWFRYNDGDDYWDKLPYGIHFKLGLHHVKNGYVYDMGTSGGVRIIANGTDTETAAGKKEGDTTYYVYEGTLTGAWMDTVEGNKNRYCYVPCYKKGITYMVNDGIGGKEDVNEDNPPRTNVLYDETGTLKTPEALRIDAPAGRSFAGWSTSADYPTTGELYKPGYDVSKITWGKYTDTSKRPKLDGKIDDEKRELYAIWGYDIKVEFEDTTGYTPAVGTPVLGKPMTKTYTLTGQAVEKGKDWVMDLDDPQVIDMLADATDAAKAAAGDIRSLLEVGNDFVWKIGKYTDANGTVFDYTADRTIKAADLEKPNPTLMIKRRRYLLSVISVDVANTTHINEIATKADEDKFGTFNVTIDGISGLGVTQESHCQVGLNYGAKYTVNEMTGIAPHQPMPAVILKSLKAGDELTSGDFGLVVYKSSYTGYMTGKQTDIHYYTSEGALANKGYIGDPVRVAFTHVVSSSKPGSTTPMPGPSLAPAKKTLTLRYHANFDPTEELALDLDPDPLLDDMDDTFGFDPDPLLEDVDDALEDAVKTVSYRPGEDVVLRNCMFKRGGYVFAGWNTEPDGTGKGYEVNGVPITDWAAGDTVDLYAQWKKPEHLKPVWDDPDPTDPGDPADPDTPPEWVDDVFGVDPAPQPDEPDTAFGVDPAQPEELDAAFGVDPDPPEEPDAAFGVDPAPPEELDDAFGVDPAPPEEPDAAFGVDPDPLPEELDDAFSV